jgi:tRNA1(Val) A37 N6-methylase TrmN6
MSTTALNHKNKKNKKNVDVAPLASINALDQPLPAVPCNPSPITLADIDTEWTKLQTTEDIHALKVFSKLGTKIIDYFTLDQRLRVIGKKGINFFQLWAEWESTYKHLPYNIKLMQWCDQQKRYMKSHYQRIINLYSLYYNMPLAFKANLAWRFMQPYKPRSVLNMCGGFGGIMLGAILQKAERYTSVEINTELKPAYEAMLAWLATKTPAITTTVTNLWQDALTVDYAALDDYDFVLSSPPYYNIEKYANNAIYKTKADWDTQFYRPLFQQVWQHLQPAGRLCLNVNKEIYDRVCVPLLGEAQTLFPMPKRSHHNAYREYIYVWQKPPPHDH